MKILIFGNGYLGNRCNDCWENATISDVHVETVEDALEEIEKHQPDVVLNAAGIKGKPNVDWCEDNQLKTIQGNTLMPIQLARAAQEAGVYMLHMGSGCIFYGDSPHDDNHWREDDFGNPKPVYSRTKWAADLVLSTLPNVGVARIRMPIDWKPSPGNLIDKLSSYPKVIDVENSVTIIDDMIDAFYQIMEKRGDDIYHVTNPGTMKHKDLIRLYREHVDDGHTCEWISNEELVELGLADKGRSNNFLKRDNLEELGVDMRPVLEALEDTIKKYAEAKRKQG
jgi:dTDP-4-dehydrorhamnose reductase